MKAHAPNIHPFAAIDHFSLYYRPFFSLSSYQIDYGCAGKRCSAPIAVNLRQQLFKNERCAFAGCKSATLFENREEDM